MLDGAFSGLIAVFVGLIVAALVAEFIGERGAGRDRPAAADGDRASDSEPPSA